MTHPLTPIAPLAAAALLLPSPVSAAPATTSITPARLSALTRDISDDRYRGRAPGGPAEAAALDMMIARLRAAGVKPAGDKGSWLQEVPLIRTQIGPGPVTLTTPQGPLELVRNRDIYLGTTRADPTIALANAPAVFVGYGVRAPERGWDDFKGVDLKGKVAIFLVNDPDFEAAADAPEKGRFGGKSMTYYGRWTYKFEEAARRGAAAALIIHDTAGAGYGWNTVTAPGGENYGLANRDPATVVPLQGWISGEMGATILRSAGLDLASLKAEAARPDFRPRPLDGVTFTAQLPVATERVISHNIVGRIPGRRHPDEAVMLGAHWDAYGEGKADADGHVTRPGALDDAVGVAGLIEIARAMQKGPAPDRTILFGIWTAEERGLLGSEFYRLAPLFPLDRIVANLTIDVLQTGGRAKNTVIIGPGQSSLEDDLRAAAGAQGRVATDESLPERGLFFRADHFTFAKAGVPSLLMMGIAAPYDLRDGGVAAGQKWLDAYMACYHQTCDRWNPGMDFAGAAEDVSLVLALTRKLAGRAPWPVWKKGSEFAPLRPSPPVTTGRR